MEQIIEQIEEQAPTNGGPPPEPEAGEPQGPRLFFKAAPLEVRFSVNVHDGAGNVIGCVPFNPVQVVYPHGERLDRVIQTAEAQAPAEWEKMQGG